MTIRLSIAAEQPEGLFADDAELAHLCSKSVRQLRTLPNEEIAGSQEHARRLLLDSQVSLNKGSSAMSRRERFRDPCPKPGFAG